MDYCCAVDELTYTQQVLSVASIGGGFVDIAYDVGGLVQTNPFFAYLNRSDMELALNPAAWHFLNFTTSTPTATVPWTPGTRHVRTSMHHCHRYASLITDRLLRDSVLSKVILVLEYIFLDHWVSAKD